MHAQHFDVRTTSRLSAFDAACLLEQKQVHLCCWIVWLSLSSVASEIWSQFARGCRFSQSAVVYSFACSFPAMYCTRCLGRLPLGWLRCLRPRYVLLLPCCLATLCGASSCSRATSTQSDPVRRARAVLPLGTFATRKRGTWKQLRRLHGRCFWHRRSSS